MLFHGMHVFFSSEQFVYGKKHEEKQQIRKGNEFPALDVVSFPFPIDSL